MNVLKTRFVIKSYYLLLLIQKTWLVPGSASNCPGGWTVVDGKCYKAVTQKASWDTAKHKCSEMGAILAEPRSSGENNALVSFMKPTSEDFWIGLNDKNSESK